MDENRLVELEKDLLILKEDFSLHQHSGMDSRAVDYARLLNPPIPPINYKNGTLTDAPFRVVGGTIYVKRLILENFIGNANASIVYTGSWTRQTVPVCYGGTRNISTTVGNYFVITFFGPSIGLFMEKASDVGKFDVYVDDVLIESGVDLYSTTLFSRPIVWQKTDMTNTKHTLKVLIANKNTSSVGEGMGFQGYTLFPSPGIRMEQLSCELYVYTVNLTTDGNGYKASTVTVPSGYTLYNTVNVRPSTTVMADATLTDPICAWRTTEIYLYNGAANTTYTITVVLLLSKL